jgi:hypothetical protein
MEINDKESLSIEYIHSLFETYKDDDFMLNKIHNYITQQLPPIFEQMKKTHDEKVQRIEDLSNEQINFINTFLVNYQYFYVSSTEKFFYYDGTHYIVNTEDDILHHILTTITRERNLLCWKQKTKTIVMKKIKENSLLKTVPESETIQNVIDCLYPVLFESRIEAKYFLCIIGDSILKKNTELIHFIDGNAKPLLRELNEMSQLLMGANIHTTFKHKYYEHDYSCCRLLKIKDTVRNDNIWRPIVVNATLDLLCVACHYSQRYESADRFLLKSTNGEIIADSVFYLKGLNQETLADDFVENFLEIRKTPLLVSTGSPTQTRENIRNFVSTTTTDGQVLSMDSIITKTTQTQITWKDMLYLWKQFIETKNIPNVISQQSLKSILTTKKLTDYYREQSDAFIGITCKHLPGIQKFIDFWNETVVVKEDEYDYEIGELCFLYKKWCENVNHNINHNINKNSNSKNTLNDKQILDLISYFYPSIEVEKDKYVYKIFCCLWNKKEDIQNALAELKKTIIGTAGVGSNNTNVKISIYDAYIFYCKYANQIHNNNEQIVSKSYFEKYVFENLVDFVVNSKYISMNWVFFEG